MPAGMTSPSSPEPTGLPVPPRLVEPVDLPPATPHGPPPLAQRLIRVLCLAGFAVAIGSALQTLRSYLIYGMQPSYFPFRNFDAAYEWLAFGADFLALPSDGLLLVGLAAEWLGKPWSRRLLRLYFWLWAGSYFLLMAAEVSFLHHLAALLATTWTFRWWNALLWEAGSLLKALVYPALLFVCLRWPELRRAEPAGNAFMPVLR